MRFAGMQFGGSNCDRDTYHVLATMQHSERASEPVLGSDDEVKIFNSMIAYIEGYRRR
ncbi:phosphoribosylformylglycinamidine synthase I [Methanoculleus chikugoensis]|jgi:phosphoribosylformylglycinamidine (FGAM) synthase-like amidotransferase family enzyme|uniref:Phosphoribosylformylglycinamidine synthase I n=1 Tax=Methanoculleus chikugoensis TaxID=118126 RepID=A0A1M4MHI2_9EURY|nr:hypothetical protein [Methanoculleus chikugoensis]MDD4568135.1 hypothetical protein [Methanoculleus chikugoensis]SCL74300.1 phosphoribosylformylglycinamidine synthase I [Methanoculleus chikugoensis]